MVISSDGVTRKWSDLDPMIAVGLLLGEGVPPPAQVHASQEKIGGRCDAIEVAVGRPEVLVREPLQFRRVSEHIRVE